MYQESLRSTAKDGKLTANTKTPVMRASRTRRALTSMEEYYSDEFRRHLVLLLKGSYYPFILAATMRNTSLSLFHC